MRWIITLIVLSLLLVPLAAQEAKMPESKEPMKVRFEDRKPFLVAGLEAKNFMDGKAMADIWDKFASLVDKIPGSIADCSYGVYFTENEQNAMSMQDYRYFAGVEIEEKVELPEGLLLHEVPGGYYAVFEYVGNIEGIGAAYGYIFGEWLVTSNYTPAGGEMFEVYDERFAGDSDESVVEIWVPIQKEKANPEDLKTKEPQPQQ
jgi:AraC family transcriptional regulator